MMNNIIDTATGATKQGFLCRISLLLREFLPLYFLIGKLLYNFHPHSILNKILINKSSHKLCWHAEFNT